MDNIMNEMAKQPLFNQINLNPNENKTYKNDVQYDAEIIGICYVPMQKWEQIYDEDTVYSAGTLFPALNKPFLGGGK